MAKIYRIELDDLALGQVIDGLETRVEAWERTAEYHRSGYAPEGFLVEECRDAGEAESIANHYRKIITSIQEQRRRQE